MAGDFPGMTAGPKKGLESSDYGADRQVSAVLAEIRLIAASVAEWVLGHGPGLAMEGPPYFFIVLEGECWLHDSGSPPVRLQVGDSVASLRGAVARLSLDRAADAFDDIGEIWQANGSPTVSVQGFDRPIRLVCGDGPAGCRLFGCAMIYARATGRSALIEQAPTVLGLSEKETGLRTWAAAISEMFRRDEGDRGAGFAIASTALAQFLLIEQLKAYISRDHDGLAGSIAGAGGGQNIWKLIHLLQQEPARAWNIAAMAREAAMSRTSFIQRFAEITGTTPFRFLAACRMDHAADLLKEGRLSVEEIAGLSGYQSPRAFRSAFQQAFGMAPRAFRAAPQTVVQTPPVPAADQDGG